MWKARSTHIAIGLVTLTVAAGVALAERPEDVYEALYGQMVDDARSSRGFDDDIEAAETLLNAAEEADNGKLKKLLCDRAYELTSEYKPGIPTAIRAAGMLRRLDRRRRWEYDERILALRRRQYATSHGEQRDALGRQVVRDIMDVLERKERRGEIDEALALCQQAERLARQHESPRLVRLEKVAERLKWRRQVRARVREFETRLEANEWDETARRELVELLTIACDKPTEAAGHVTPDFDAEYRELLPLAAKQVRHVEPENCLRLGDWYARICEGRERYAQITALQRSVEYYTRFLEVYEADDARRTKAEIALRTVIGRLAELRNPDLEIPKDLVPGVTAKYYVLDNPKSVPDFGKLKPFATRTPPKLFHHTRDSKGTWQFPKLPKGKSIGGVFTAYIELPTDGTYTFWLNTSDGAKLYIDNELVVNNDGRHDPREKSGQVDLTGGKHAFRIEWFNHSGYGRVVPFWNGPLIRKKEVIPPKAYFRPKS